MKKRRSFFCLIAVIMLFTSGCQVIKIEDAPRTPVEYSIVEPVEIPREILTLVEERKAREFQLTFQSGEDLYLVKGYGQQMTGGYSIQVEELGASETTVFFDTKLIGPSDDSLVGEPSYPYIVVKMAYREQPVEFE